MNEPQYSDTPINEHHASKLVDPLVGLGIKGEGLRAIIVGDMVVLLNVTGSSFTSHAVHEPGISHRQHLTSMVSHFVSCLNYTVKDEPIGPVDLWQHESWQHLVNVSRCSFTRAKKWMLSLNFVMR